MFGLEKHSQKAAELSALLLKDLPPQSVMNQNKLLSVNRVTQAVESLAGGVGVYSRQEKLGFIGRAVLLNALKWRFKELGYPNDFSDLVLEAAMVACVGKKRQTIIRVMLSVNGLLP